MLLALLCIIGVFVVVKVVLQTLAHILRWLDRRVS